MTFGEEGASNPKHMPSVYIAKHYELYTSLSLRHNDREREGLLKLIDFSRKSLNIAP